MPSHSILILSVSAWLVAKKGLPWTNLGIKTWVSFAHPEISMMHHRIAPQQNCIHPDYLWKGVNSNPSPAWGNHMITKWVGLDATDACLMPWGNQQEGIHFEHEGNVTSKAAYLIRAIQALPFGNRVSHRHSWLSSPPAHGQTKHMHFCVAIATHKLQSMDWTSRCNENPGC